VSDELKEAGEDDGFWGRLYSLSGDEKIAFLEEAIARADLCNDVKRGMTLRDELVETAIFGGRVEKSLVAFNWILAHCDKDDQFSWQRKRALTFFKWIAGHVYEFPQVPMAEIDRVFEGMEQWYRAAGEGLRPVYKLRALAAIDLGNFEAALRFREQWQASSGGDSADCKACERNHEVHFLIACGEDARAIEHATPILRGELRCALVPDATHSRLLLPMLRLERFKEAEELHRKSFAKVKRNRALLPELAEHLAFLSLTGADVKGLRLLEERLGWVLETHKLYDRFWFSLAAWGLMTKILTAGREEIGLRFPKLFPELNSDGHYPVRDLQAWFLNDAREVAGAFDCRGGTDYFLNLIERHRALIQLDWGKQSEDGR